MKKTLSLFFAALLLLTMVPMAIAEGKDEKEPVTLRIYHGLYNRSSWDGFINDTITELIGVRVEAVEGYTIERTQAMLAAGDLPDLGNYCINRSLDQAMAGGLVVDMAGYLDLLPNLTGDLKYLFEVGKKVYSQDLGYYALPVGVGPAEAKYEFPIDPSANTMNFKWDVYTAIGAPEVKDIHALIDVLKQMVEYQPELEDGTKTWGLGITAGWSEGSNDMWPATAYEYQFGLKRTQGFWLLDYKSADDVVIYDALLDENSPEKEALHFFFECNQAGLLDPDSVTMAYGAGQAKVDKGTYMVSGFAQWGASNVYMPVSADWQNATLNGVSKYGGYVDQPLSISATSEHLEEAFALLNLMYDYDFLFVMNNGPQGVLWDIDADGNYYATDEYQKVLDTSEYYLNGENIIDGNPFFADDLGLIASRTLPGTDVCLTISRWPEIVALKLSDPAYASYKQVTGFDRPINYFYENNRVWNAPSFTVLMGAFDEDAQMMFNAIQPTIMTTEWKMIYAADEAEFESLWNELNDTVQAMGYAEVQEAAKEIIENAKALEISFEAN